MLAASDIPPLRSFVWVVAGLALICIGLALAIPWLWEVGQCDGLWAVLVRACGIGLIVGLLLATMFALFSSGEPSAPPMNAAAYLIWFSVVMVVGAVNGVIVGLVISWRRPRRAHEDGAREAVGARRPHAAMTSAIGQCQISGNLAV